MHLSLTNRRWILNDLQEKKDLITTLMERRGIVPITQLGKMLAPTIYPDIAKAVERIERAITNNETIGIFGDYDCDGITGTAQLVRMLRRRAIEPVVRLPHRVHDGYGLSVAIVREMKQAGVSLLITVDTGIASYNEITTATKEGIDVIVTDHHHVPEVLPSAHAVLHPALAPDFPLPHPSGSGVALSLVRAMEGDQWPDMETDIILASIGTVADLVPMQGENRLLVHHGLHFLTRCQYGPIAQLKEQCGLTGTACTSTDIGFRIAPRINAAGRMDDPTIALSGLLGDSDALAELETLNKRRQGETETCVQEALKELNLEKQTRQTDAPLLVASSPNYGHGIIGLIAGRLTQTFGKPSIAVAIDGDLCTASLRSPPCYHITKGLQKHEELLISYGGHAQAAGCSFGAENLAALREGLAEDILATTKPNDLVPTITIDAEITEPDLTLALCKNLKQLAPHGIGNEPPYFLLRNVQLDTVRTVGSDQSHLQARLGKCKLIGFGLGHLENACKEPVDLVCQIGVDTWGGRESVQLVVEDIDVSQN